MGAFLWIYALSCLMVHQAASSVQSTSAPNGERTARRNYKMSKEFPDPGYPMKNFDRINKLGRKHPLNDSIADETNEIPDELDPKIINGREAQEGEFPWMVALHYNGEFICSSFLIAPDIVMTAAHCVQFENGVEPATAFYGIIGNINRNGPETRIDFSEVIVHPEYGAASEGDIALFRTTQPVQLSDKIQTICLPEAVRNFDDEKAQAMGWGATSNIPRPPPETLMATELNVMPQKTCAFIFMLTGIRITDRHVCTNSPKATGVCYGDSGGPLVYEDEESGKPLAIGIASFVTRLGCGRPFIPSVYTATAGYNDWITETAGQNSGICFIT